MVPLDLDSILDISNSEIKAKAKDIYARDAGMCLMPSDMDMVRVFARGLIVLERLGTVISAPTFQVNNSGALSLHPIHTLYEAERRLTERLSMRLGLTPVARTRILGAKLIRDLKRAGIAGRNQSATDKVAEEMGMVQ